MKTIYKNGKVFFRGEFSSVDFAVENGIFTTVGKIEPEAGNSEVDLNGRHVIPGLVDVHTHGSMGADFSDGDYDGIAGMAKYLAESGVTSFAPAGMTLPYETLGKAFRCGRKFHDDMPSGHARLMGIHMEGPFFSEKKKGAQNGAYLRNPDIEAFNALQDSCGGLIRIVDIAPELPGSVAFAKVASESATVSLAHTDATYEEAKAAIEAGASHLTHLYNAMPPIHHRKPGVIGAGSEADGSENAAWTGKNAKADGVGGFSGTTDGLGCAVGTDSTAGVNGTGNAACTAGTDSMAGVNGTGNAACAAGTDNAACATGYDNAACTAESGNAAYATGSAHKPVIAELICDGYHIHPSSVRMAFKLFPGRICLISDSLRCCGMPDGRYELGGQDVFLSGGVARLEDGTIAGSASNLYTCMLNAISFGIPLEEAIIAATRIPAEEIGAADKIGSIEPGRYADFVICNENLAPLQVYVGGLPVGR